MSPSIEAVTAVVAAFLRRTNGKLNGIAADTPLLRGGLLDSFGVLSLSAEVSDVLQLNLPTGSLMMEDFESPRVLWERITQLRSSESRPRP